MQADTHLTIVKVAEKTYLRPQSVPHLLYRKALLNRA